MHLVYVDESGNTGMNLKDLFQPIFVLAALIVPETCWQELERQLESSLQGCLPNSLVEEVEVHGGDLRRGTGGFEGIPLAHRIALRTEWLQLAQKRHLKLVYRRIEKKKYEHWMQQTFGSGVEINPYVAAFLLVARVVNEYLEVHADKALGMFIFDENKEISRDIEKSIRFLRGIVGPLRLGQIVEKGFFIDSKKSRVLQLCDLCALTARKKEESISGFPVKGFDQDGGSLIEPLIHRGNEAFLDVTSWLTAQRNIQKK